MASSNSGEGNSVTPQSRDLKGDFYYSVPLYGSGAAVSFIVFFKIVILMGRISRRAVNQLILKFSHRRCRNKESSMLISEMKGANVLRGWGGVVVG